MCLAQMQEDKKLMNAKKQMKQRWNSSGGKHWLLRRMREYSAVCEDEFSFWFQALEWHVFARQNALPLPGIHGKFRWHSESKVRWKRIKEQSNNFWTLLVIADTSRSEDNGKKSNWIHLKISFLCVGLFRISMICSLHKLLPEASNGIGLYGKIGWKLHEKYLISAVCKKECF